MRIARFGENKWKNIEEKWCETCMLQHVANSLVGVGSVYTDPHWIHYTLDNQLNVYIHPKFLYIKCKLPNECETKIS